MWQLGLPKPVVQPRLKANGRRFRADFGWPEFGVLGEFDGRMKYDELLRPGESALLHLAPLDLSACLRSPRSAFPAANAPTSAAVDHSSD